MTYSIKATALDNNGVHVDANIPEVLGEAFGVKYATRDEAQSEADEIADQADAVRFPGLKLEVTE